LPEVSFLSVSGYVGQPVSDALMIALGVVVFDEFCDEASQMPLT
jgi:hypothetical protein